jgi:hypothetical protein
MLKMVYLCLRNIEVNRVVDRVLKPLCERTTQRASAVGRVTHGVGGQARVWNAGERDTLVAERGVRGPEPDYSEPTCGDGSGASGPL